MGAFGGTSPKPIHLWGDWSGLKWLRRASPDGGMDERLMSKSPKCSNGKSKDMKASSEYTQEFAEAVAQEFKNPSPSVLDSLCGSMPLPSELPSWDEVKAEIDTMVKSVINYGNLAIFELGCEMQADQVAYIKNPRFLPKDVVDEDVATAEEDSADGKAVASLSACTSPPPKRRLSVKTPDNNKTPEDLEPTADHLDCVPGVADGHWQGTR